MSGCRSVCPFVTSVYSGKTADWIEMPFGMVGRVGQRYHMLERSISKYWQILLEMGRRSVTYRENVASAVQKRQNRLNCRLRW